MREEDARVGIVVIGRNEGERLVACLRSLEGLTARTVYVDSGSIDGSVEKALSLGAQVVSLDMTRPFTAARARNAGFAALDAVFPETKYAQFIDGDCTLDDTWLGKAEAFLDVQSDIAVVCGRRRERFPERSAYNRLCDMEWDTPVGEATECGGDILVRMAAFREVEGFSEELIAGEEPELCVRLRAAGWRIWRLDAEMTMHDANMTRFGQWWRRSMRGGHAFAEVSARHAGSPLRIWRRNSTSALFWGLVLPTAIVILSAVLHPVIILFLLVYPLQIVRIAMRNRELGGDKWLYALFAVLAKFPEMQGVVRFHVNRMLKRASTLIEYK